MRTQGFCALPEVHQTPPTPHACLVTWAAGYVAHKIKGTMPVGTVLHLVQKYLGSRGGTTGATKSNAGSQPAQRGARARARARACFRDQRQASVVIAVRLWFMMAMTSPATITASSVGGSHACEDGRILIVGPS